jgi:hypothetical protein
MTFLLALLPQSPGYDSVEGRVHNPNWHSRSKLRQMFTVSLDDPVDRMWYVPRGFSTYPAWSRKSSIAAYFGAGAGECIGPSVRKKRGASG